MIYAFYRDSNDSLWYITRGTRRKVVNEVNYLDFIGRIKKSSVVYTDRKHAKKFILVSAKMNLNK